MLNLHMIKDILSNIRKIREQGDYSQDSIAGLMDISQAKYARFERGSTKTDLDLVVKFAEATDMTIIDVITFPEKFVNSDSVDKLKNENKLVLQISIEEERMDKVLNFVLQNDNVKLM